MQRVQLSLIGVGVAAVALSAFMLYSERGSVREPARSEESPRGNTRAASGDASGRSLSVGADHDSTTRDQSASSKSPGAVAAGKQTGAVRPGTVAGESAMAASVRAAQTLTVGDSGRGGSAAVAAGDTRAAAGGV